MIQFTNTSKGIDDESKVVVKIEKMGKEAQPDGGGGVVIFNKYYRLRPNTNFDFDRSGRLDDLE